MNLLLDTTIQIDRATGSKERKEAVEKVLKGNKLYCSTYVLGEYYANIVTDLLTLYGLYLLDRDMGETGKRITERVFGRNQSRAQKLYANILSLCEFDVSEVEDTFQLYIDLLPDMFFIDIEDMIDKTKCVKAEREIVYEEGVPRLSKVSCTNRKKICDVCQLWEESRQEVQELMSSEKVDKKIKKILHDAQSNEKAYRGDNCKTLGDTIISLEALKSGCELGVCTSNKKDFEPICEVIGLELVTTDYSWKK